METSAEPVVGETVTFSLSPFKVAFGLGKLMSGTRFENSRAGLSSGLPSGFFTDEWAFEPVFAKAAPRIIYRYREKILSVHRRPTQMHALLLSFHRKSGATRDADASARAPPFGSFAERDLPADGYRGCSVW